MPVVPPDIDGYAAAHTTPPSPSLVRLADQTRRSMEAHEMMVGPVEGRFLEFLVHMTGARRVLEIGMFTGYSALSMAAALPSGGRLVTCDVDPAAEAVARPNIEGSPWADRVEIRMGPALETMAELASAGENFDLVFIDADKANYRAYYEAALGLLSARGVIAVDNVLWSGRVLEPDGDGDGDTRAIVEFNDFVARDERVVCVMLTVRDGVTLIRRLEAPPV